ncbi:hypothetical protein BJ944DRAFT_245099, partial [Cunninghamella echinulata]
MPALTSEIKNTHFAKFATTSRLIACLVSESLVKAIYVPGAGDQESVKGVCVLLRPTVSTLSTIDDILAAVPLRGVPIIEKQVDIKGTKCGEIILVDGWDMLPHIYSLSNNKQDSYLPPVTNAQATRTKVATILSSLLQDLVESTQLVDGFDAVQLWNKFATDYKVTEKLIQLIGQELDSSMINQAYTYNNPKDLPTLESSTVHWEQIILEGHATHP